MPARTRLVTRLAALSLVATVACERGCLARRLADVEDAAALPGVALDSVDCPDGLARCVDGRLERSKLATVDPRKPGGCPWEEIATCSCVERVTVPEARARQLCRSVDGGVALDPARPAARCPGEGPRWACVDSRVVDCERNAAVATCLRGCALDELEDEVSDDDAEVILCAR